MSRSRVVIEVTPSRLEAAVVRAGRIVRSAAVRHPGAPGEWDQHWPAALDALKQNLADLILGLDAKGLPAMVLAATPTAAVNIHACPASAGASAASSAAALALGNVFSSALNEHPSVTMPLFRDRSAAGPNEKPMRHVLAAAETDASAESIARWVEAAGLRFEGIFPLQAVESIAAADAAVGNADHDGTRAVLWIGEHQSVLAVGSPERLRFVRPIALGTESLADALTRPITRRGSTDEPITLTRDEARAMLNRVGIPEPSQRIDEQRGLEGAAILPLLQPTLQRLGIEVKQSLRFGLTESERNDTNVVILGHGRTIPNLRAAIQRHLAAADARPRNATPAGEAADSEYLSSDRGGIRAFTNRSWNPPPLLPAARSRSISLNRTRVTLRVGMAACLCLVAIDGGAAAFERYASAAHPAQSDSSAAASASSAEALALARASESALSSLVESRLGSRPPIGPWLAEVALAAKGRVQLVEIRSEPGESGPVARIKGVTLPAGSPDQEPLREFINLLSACPLVNEAKLNHTQRSKSDDGNVQAFEVALTFVGLPASIMQANADASRQEAAP